MDARKKRKDEMESEGQLLQQVMAAKPRFSSSQEAIAALTRELNALTEKKESLFQNFSINLKLQINSTKTPTARHH